MYKPHKIQQFYNVKILRVGILTLVVKRLSLSARTGKVGGSIPTLGFSKKSFFCLIFMAVVFSTSKKCFSSINVVYIAKLM